MAGEVIHSSDDADTLYFLVYRPSDGYIYDEGDAAFEAVGTWNDARVGECDNAMTAYGDTHIGNFPTVAAGVYFVQVRLQAGANPDTDDRLVGQGIIYWDGSAEVSIFALNTQIGAVIPAGYVGDYRVDDTVYFVWRTKATPSVDGTIRVYKNDGTGEVTAPTGIDDTGRDFDGIGNVHLCIIDLSANSFYAVKRDYSVVLAGATISGQSVDIPIASFSIENRFQGIDFKRDV